MSLAQWICSMFQPEKTSISGNDRSLEQHVDLKDTPLLGNCHTKALSAWLRYQTTDSVIEWFHYHQIIADHSTIEKCHRNLLTHTYKCRYFKHSCCSRLLIVKYKTHVSVFLDELLKLFITNCGRPFWWLIELHVNHE